MISIPLYVSRLRQGSHMSTTREVGWGAASGVHAVRPGRTRSLSTLATWRRGRIFRYSDISGMQEVWSQKGNGRDVG